MVSVELTRHLYQLFPALEGKELVVEASTVADVVRELDRIAPGIAFYICDERGRLRTHVNIFVESFAEPAVVDDPPRSGIPHRRLDLFPLFESHAHRSGGHRP